MDEPAKTEARNYLSAAGFFVIAASELLLILSPEISSATRSLIVGIGLLQIWTDLKKTVLFVTHDIDEAIYLSDDIYVLSPRPGRLKTKITVDLPRPRTEATMLSDEFVSLKQQLLSLLKDDDEEQTSLKETV